MCILVKKRELHSQKKSLIISVSSKTLKKATDRNKIKRRVREVIRPYLKNRDKDYFVIIKPGIDKLSFSDLKQKIEKQL